MDLDIRISKNKMSARVTIPEGYRPSAIDLRRLLASSGVVYGVLDEMLDRIEVEELIGEFEVAQGTPPLQGEDASIEYFFRTGRPSLVPQIRADGRADYFNLGVVESAEKGQLLARKTPAVVGKSGRTVTGEEVLPRTVKDVPLRAGRGVDLAAGGLEIHAGQPGQPQLSRGTLSISPTFTVAGDVDFSVGNIEFNGNVEIMGSVGNNFIVRSDGNITVHGMVEGATLIAGGLIMIMGGVRQGASLSAAGDVQVRFMENSSVKTKSSFFVKDDLIFSEVEADNTIEVDGSIIGGQCKADVAVKAEVIGSKMGTVTHIILIPKEKWSGVLRSNEQRMNETKAKLEKVEEGLHTLQQLRDRYGKLHPEKEELYERLSGVSTSLKQEMLEITKLVLQSKAKCENLPHPKVIVRQTIHPGTYVRLNAAHLKNETALQVSSVYEEDGKIRYH
ncbi:MAG: DUF342 domain-containing protein [Cyanobacteria bacterium NC_groundwater_1444_Ag_S-0.65um_54_12]|nr:DUF342 domain-containing protein [Cyanobacteria bacterium NC_groundwater_1444_Ag_S-0.65um_54_12]